MTLKKKFMATVRKLQTGRGKYDFKEKTQGDRMGKVQTGSGRYDIKEKTQGNNAKGVDRKW